MSDRTVERIWLLAEPPATFAHLAPDQFDVTGLPDGFIEQADAELQLTGELISYVQRCGPPEIRKVERVSDTDLEVFFTAFHITEGEMSAPWEVFYATGASGARYSVVVEYVFPYSPSQLGQ